MTNPVTKKAYWVSAYKAVPSPEQHAAYSKTAGAAVIAAGGRVIARGLPAAVHEDGLQERVVLIEFDSLEKAMAAYHSPAYQAALEAFGGNGGRDIRVIEGV